MKKSIHVLVVDDEAFVRESLREVLTLEGLRATAVAGVGEALAVASSEPVHVIVTDLSMPQGGGLALLREVRSSGVDVPVIVISGVGTVADAVAAMKSGAFDFLQKPVDPEELLIVIGRAAEHQGLRAEVARLRSTVDALRPTQMLVGGSPEMQRVRAAIAQVAPTDAAVLIHGETGTGKELVSHEIHRKSARAARPLLRINCTAFSDPQALESELFGHKKGAFAAASADRVGRLAEADGGTFVLDEIGALPLATQPKVLRFLETGEYELLGDARTRHADVRLVAITNEELADKVATARFREDLLSRLSVFPIATPALRSHKGDLHELAQHFLSRPHGPRARAERTQPFTLAADALEVLSSYEWPGNVRELRNVLERAVIVATTSELGADVFRGILESALASPKSSGPYEFHLRANLDALERKILLRVLTHTKNHRKEAALLLGIDPRNLSYYLKKHRISEAEIEEHAKT
ncbi:MAG: sigma-54-dependent Fis family transcriptional regulator [Planctomycetes bacterium]|nr:sigma-54-dependent Fis family transcriptional regulator [Planctomycetota bacterium]